MFGFPLAAIPPPYSARHRYLVAVYLSCLSLCLPLCLALCLACITAGVAAAPAPQPVHQPDVSAVASKSGQIQLLPSPAQANSLAPRLTLASDGTPWLSWLEAVEVSTSLRNKAGKTKTTTKPGYALKISAYRDGQFSPALEVARGSNWVANWADTPHLFAANDGWLLAQWLEKSGNSTYAYDVKLSYSQDAGAHWSAPFSPHADDDSASEHGFLSFFPLSHPAENGTETISATQSAADSGQNVVTKASANGAHNGAGMVWLDGRQTSTGGAMSLRAAALGRNGQWQWQQALDLQVCDCCQTGATLTHSGPVVVYRNRTDDEVRDIYLVKQSAGEVSSSDGPSQAWSEPIRVHADEWRIAGCPVNGPQVASLGDEVAVLWYTMGEDFGAVKLARSEGNISRFGPPYTLARDTALGRVSLAHTRAGLALAWIEELPHQNDLQLVWLRLSTDLSSHPSGLQERQRLRIAQVPKGRASGFPSLVGLNDGSSLLTWTGQQDKQLQVMLARVLAPAEGNTEHSQALP